MDMKNMVFGECIHGRNMAACHECNPLQVWDNSDLIKIKEELFGMKLISMVEFVLSQNQDDDAQFRMKKYANFLKQLLELWMFVPCGEDGKPLEEPRRWTYFEDCENKGWSTDGYSKLFDAQHEGEDISKYLQYQKAKERVLFEGCSKYFIEDIVDGTRELKGTIEDLSKNLTLTETALKQIGL